LTTGLFDTPSFAESKKFAEAQIPECQDDASNQQGRLIFVISDNHFIKPGY
jgi:hypothetical protein